MSIAFVVVSSVFAFGTLSTGLFATDKAKQTIHAGLYETSGTMEPKSSVSATNDVTGSAGYVSDLSFWVANAAGAQNSDLSPGNAIIKYTDPNQTKTFDGTFGSTYMATPLGRADSDSFMEMGLTFEIKLIGIESGGANGLTSNLITNTTFSLEVIPSVGAVLHLERTTPEWFNGTDNLD